MKQFIIVLMLLSLMSFSTETNYPTLDKVTHSKSKSEINFYYKSAKAPLRFRYMQVKSGVDLHMIQNKKLVFASQVRKGQIYFRTGGDKSFVILNREKIQKVNPAILSLLYNHLQDQQAMSGANAFAGSSSSLTGGMDMLGDVSETFGSSNAGDCRISLTCTCQSGSTISIQCDCGGVAYCEDRTVTVCDRDDAGNEVNCREITNCTGGCGY